MADTNFSVSISTISGGSVGNILKILSENTVEPRYYPRVVSSLLFSVFAEPFRWWEHLRYDGAIRSFQLKNDPVFVLGHWRSGTTHLHNLLCKDPQMGYVTTYQGVFPELLLGSSWLFKTFMKLMMPEKRASDNVELSADYPQEEEFALGNTNPYGYYNFWFFPKQVKTHYERFIEFKNADERMLARWKSDYVRLVKKALLNTKGERFISKNPPHTGRIKQILEIFPQAKFVHIYRNPVVIFISTKKLIESTIPSLKFQDITGEEIEESILWVYERIMQAYLRDRALIPADNLIELRFEDFEHNTLHELERIYGQLHIPGFEKAKPHFQQYINAQKSYKKNTYSLPRSTVDRITTRWKFAMDAWNYRLPENLEVIG